jgi:hypothetical protein
MYNEQDPRSYLHLRGNLGPIGLRFKPEGSKAFCWNLYLGTGAW